MKLFLVLLLLSTSLYGYPLKPTHQKSPGQYCTVYDKDFERFRYPERIAYCRRNVSMSTKDWVCTRDGVRERRPDYTVDHIVPLSLGGSNHVTNLWCQHRAIYTGNMEYHYYRMVDQGRTPRLQAVHEILKCKFHRECGVWSTIKSKNREH